MDNVSYMQKKDLVSILTPCYNGATLICRLLDSILIQDYQEIEMFVIDDGSTDHSKEVIESYIQKFSARGYKLNYIYQDNGGQSVAINNGLKLVNGEYLIWPDCDDWYNSSSAISTMVSELEKLPNEYAMARCGSLLIDEVSWNEIRKTPFNNECLKPNQFLNCLYNRNYFWGAGNYILRMSHFDKVNPTREIYTEKSAGQNWQIHLPVLYSYKVHTITQHLHTILVRSNSHSNKKHNDSGISRITSYENTLLNTLQRINEMPQEEKDHHIKEITIQYSLEKLKVLLEAGKYGQVHNYYCKLKQLKPQNLTKFDSFCLWCSQNAITAFLWYKPGKLGRNVSSKLLYKMKRLFRI